MFITMGLISNFPKSCLKLLSRMRLGELQTEVTPTALELRKSLKTPQDHELDLLRRRSVTMRLSPISRTIIYIG